MSKKKQPKAEPKIERVEAAFVRPINSAQAIFDPAIFDNVLNNIKTETPVQSWAQQMVRRLEILMDERVQQLERDTEGIHVRHEETLTELIMLTNIRHALKPGPW